MDPAPHIRGRPIGRPLFITAEYQEQCPIGLRSEKNEHPPRTRMDGGELHRMNNRSSMYNSWVGCTPMFNDDVSRFTEQYNEEDYLFDDPGLSILTSSEWREMSHYKYAPKTMSQRLRDEWSEDEQA